MKLLGSAGLILLPFVGVAAATDRWADEQGARCGWILASSVSQLQHLLPKPGLAEGGGDIAGRAVGSIVVSAIPDVAESTDSCASAEPQGATSRRGTAKPGRAQASLPSLRVGASTVLRLANGGARPSGRFVAADGKRPAGLVVAGASALGIGVRDGDVLTDVEGVSVTSVGQVISLVIAARGARRAVVAGRLWRGQAFYTLTVEQPYLVARSGTAPPAAADGPGVESGLAEGAHGPSAVLTPDSELRTTEDTPLHGSTHPVHQARPRE